MRESLRLVVVLTLVCLIAALALAGVDRLTKEPRLEQKRLARLRAIRAVLPPFDNDPLKDKKEIERITFYIGKKEGEIIGVAFSSKGEGYSGFITIMMGVNPEDNSITGIEILEHMETPGLGANIEKGEFKNQFKEKSLANSKLVDGKLAVKKNKGDIEALTGATISSRGVTEAVDKGLKVFLKYKEEILGEKKPEVTDG
ncbi:RnfABCDGE type electron transport complex subunit G [bacterium]|nr:RnfABCDGE type electron transport complex subunit G [bacterium]MCG2676351.1 RnfABCDGE type electron transport complex subunit G [bacterium]